MPSFGLPSARAEASRRNGAKSRGPKTPEGKARSALNALKHGLRAQHLVALGDEDLDAFDALEAALMAELAPQTALQAVLARRIVSASWRLERAERMEGELFAQNVRGTTSFGLAMIRDCDGARAFETLLRYRRGTLAELWRSLRTFKELQAEAAVQAAAEAAAQQEALAPAPALAAVTRAPAPTVRAPAPARAAQPDEPERRKNLCDSDRTRNLAERNAEPGSDPAWPLPLPAPGPVAERGPTPFLARAPGGRAAAIEPERRRNPGERVPPPAAEITKNGRTSLLAGTALVPAVGKPGR